MGLALKGLILLKVISVPEFNPSYEFLKKLKLAQLFSVCSFLTDTAQNKKFSTDNFFIKFN